MRANIRLAQVIPQPVDIPINSGWCALHRAVGHMATKEVRLNPGDGAAHSVNLFAFTGDIELKAIYGRITDVTNIAALTACSWDVYDGAATVQLTSAAGVALSGYSLNSLVLKDQTAAAAATGLNASQVRVNEVAATPRQFQGALLVAKSATTCYVRWMYTGAVATDCKILFTAIWVCRYPGSTFVAV